MWELEGMDLVEEHKFLLFEISFDYQRVIVHNVGRLPKIREKRNHPS